MAPEMILLLKAASQGRKDLSLATFCESQIRWAIGTGFGPLLFQTARADPEAVTSPLWPLLRGANLTARMLTCEQLDAMSEIIDVCEGRVPPLTLLKGISICEQYYPEPHLRPMRDIDFVVEAADLPVVESILINLGYRQRSKAPPEFYENHHHSMPFFHPQRGVWVEVHRGLVPPKSKPGADKVFSLENVKTQIGLSEFRGKKVTRLSNELQIIYIASHWAYSFSIVGGMVAMLDMIYLLKNTKDTIHWDQILGWVDGCVAATYLYLLLSYLDKHQLIDIVPEILRGLFLRQRSLRRVSLKIMHALIDRYLVDGRTFGRVLSPRNVDILWKTLLLPRSPIRNLMVLPGAILLPYQLRAKFLL